jgi:hypothetical protein
MNIVLKTGSVLSAIATFTTVATVATAPANALTFTVEGPGVLTSTQAGVTTIDFTGGAPANYSGQFITPLDSVAGVATAPIAGNQFISTQNVPATDDASFQASFAAGLSYFGLYWGTIDTYNTISFLTNTGVESFTGTEIANDAGFFNPINSGNFEINRFVNFFAAPGQVITGITFSSEVAAFESDNHAFRVIPTPALLPGLVALGVGVLRKRKSEVEA